MHVKECGKLCYHIYIAMYRMYVINQIRTHAAKLSCIASYSTAQFKLDKYMRTTRVHWTLTREFDMSTQKAELLKCSTHAKKRAINTHSPHGE